MATYLGSIIVDKADTPYAGHTALDWTRYWLIRYGSVGGDHHKAWVIDRALRSSFGFEPIVKRASWDDGTVEYRVRLPDQWTAEYEAFRRQCARDYLEEDFDEDAWNDTAVEDRAEMYDYDEGVAP